MLTLGVTLAVIVIAVGAIVYQLKPAGSSNISNRQTWYYDLNTNKLFTDKAIQLPPIATSSGDFEGEPAGVRALVFVDTNGDRHIAWLEKYSVEAKAAMEKQLEMATTGEIDYEIETAIESGRMIKRPDDATWVSEMSMEAQEIREELMQKAANEGWRVHQPK